MEREQIIDVTLWLVQTSLLILQIQDSYDINKLCSSLIPLVVITILIIISAIQQVFQLKLLIFGVIKKLILLTILSYEPLNNNNNNTIEQIIKIKYLILGVYFSNIVQVNQNLITWRNLIRYSIYTYLSITIILISQDSHTDYLKNIIFLIIFTMPHEISLLYLIFKLKSQKFNQANIVILRETQNQIKFEESRLEIVNKLQNQTSDDVFRLFFDNFPYGMILLGDEEQIVYVNRGLNEILNENDHIKVLQRLFDLQNCTQEFKEEDQFNKLFEGLNCRSKSFKNIDQDQYNDSPQMQFFSRSESLNVRNVYLKAIQIANTKIVQCPEIQYQKNDFIYQFKLICRLENIIEINSIEERKEFNLFDEDQVIENKNKIIEVKITSFIQNGKANAWIMVRDVTFFNELNVVKQMNQNKSQMLSQVAHEFRTPLNCIVLLSESSIEKNSGNLTLIQQYLQPILTSAYQLLSLVNDLLDLSQLRAGKFTIVNQQFDIISLMNNIYKMLLPLAQVRNLYLLIDIAQNIPKIFTSDPNRIRQIIMNLISNSLKFTFKGGITLTLTCESFNYYKISVYDTGIGIDIEDQSRLFQAFGKLEKTQHLNQQGVGLGLMISHIMAQRLQQSYQDEKTTGLIANSEGKNRGSLFSFVIFDHTNFPKIYQSKSSQFDLKSFQFSQNKIFSPQMVRIGQINQINNTQNQQFQNIQKQGIIKSTSIQNKEYSPILIQDRIQKRGTQLQPLNIRIQGECHEDFSPKNLSSKQINMPNNRYWFKQCQCKELLIVDDQPFNIQALTLSLDNFNLKIASVNSNYQTVKLLNEIKSQLCCQWIRIILMDLEMPISDGFDTTINIRNMEEVIRLTNKNFLPAYIIGCSGHGLEYRQKCLNIGMDDYITKPVRKMDLINIIDRLTRKHQQQ